MDQNLVLFISVNILVSLIGMHPIIWLKTFIYFIIDGRIVTVASSAFQLITVGLGTVDSAWSPWSENASSRRRDGDFSRHLRAEVFPGERLRDAVVYVGETPEPIFSTRASAYGEWTMRPDANL